MNSPLDQFIIFSIFNFQFFNFQIAFTNFLFTSLLVLVILELMVYFSSSSVTKSFFVVPSSWQFLLEGLYSLGMTVLCDIVGRTKGEKYSPVLTLFFVFIVANNLIGLVPYSFTITSHVMLTFFLSFSIFVAMNIIGFDRHGVEFLSFFLPANTGFYLATLLVPIEIISYFAKPISLGVRLFINLMAGHSLLKVIVGFAWDMMLFENIQAVVFVIPLIVLVLLIGLELGVALIQAYVFITLTSIYLNESESLH